MSIAANIDNAARQMANIDQHGDKKRMGKMVAAGKVEKIILQICVKIEFCKPFRKDTVYLIEIFNVKI